MIAYTFCGFYQSVTVTRKMFRRRMTLYIEETAFISLMPPNSDVTTPLPIPIYEQTFIFTKFHLQSLKKGYKKGSSSIRCFLSLFIISVNQPLLLLVRHSIPAFLPRKQIRQNFGYVHPNHHAL